MFAAFIRFAVTVAAVPLCAEYLAGVKMLDTANALLTSLEAAAREDLSLVDVARIDKEIEEEHR